MASLVEFHVSSFWCLKPSCVRQIISQLKASEFARAQILFDARRNWFQITCQDEDELKIKRQLKLCLEQAEEDALDQDEGLVDEEGALVKSMDQNAVIRLWDENALPEAFDFTEYRLPDEFEGLPCTEVWELTGCGSLRDLLTKDQFQDIRKIHNVKMAINHSLTEVYLGAWSKEELDRVTTKLNVLVKIKELSISEPVHLLWTEAYKEDDDVQMTFDTRFLANIDPAFVGATYLDVGRWTDSIEEYEILAQAITLRLCRYDRHRGYQTSLVGPKLKARSVAPANPGKRRYKARCDSATHAFGVGIVSQTSSSISPARKRAVKTAYGEGDVEKWLDELEESYGIATTTNNQESSSHSSTAVRQLSDFSSNHLSIFDEPTAVRPSFTLKGKENPRVPSQGRSLLDLDDPFVTSDTMLAPLSFPTRPLKSHAENDSSITIPKTCNTGRSLVEDDAPTPPIRRAGTTQASSVRYASTGSGATRATAVGRPTARPETVAAQLPAWFIQDINTAVASLVATGPYLRGRVDLHADLGRILITGMDYTGLAFNVPGSQSNGWTKGTLLRLLNQGSRHGAGHSVAFTKILSQDGDDIEYILTVSNMATGKELWRNRNEGPDRVVYSFHCVSKGDSFFLDVEAGKSGDKFDYSLRSKQDDSAPIWIHCTLRSWDARIIMSHTDTDGLEAKHGEFARSLVDSFAVTLAQNNQLQVKIGLHKGFAVSVESMRINTCFRFLSDDEKSYLDITEVEETVFKPNALPNTTTSEGGLKSPDEWMVYVISPKRMPSDVRDSEKRGMPTFWYEASVRSVEAEKEMAVNQTIAFGEKASWDFGKLSELGVIASIVKPALRMVQTIDSVGAHNNNYQAAKLALPPGNTEEVPGANYITKRGSSGSRSASRPRIPLSRTTTQAQDTGPPGVVAARPSPRRYPTSPSTTLSPLAVSARNAAVAAASSPPQKRGEPMGASSDNQNNNCNNNNNNNAYSPGARNGGRSGGGGFGVAVPRAVSHSRPQGRRDPSSTGSNTSRAPTASYRPPDKFW